MTSVSEREAALEVALVEDDFDRILLLLKFLKEKFHAEFKDLTALAEYSRFVESPQYSEWMARREEVAQHEPWPREMK